MMRTEAFVNRLMVATREENPDVKKIARMVEQTLNRVSSTPAGEEALRIVQKRLVKDALKRFAVAETVPARTNVSAQEIVVEPEPKKTVAPENEKPAPGKSAPAPERSNKLKMVKPQNQPKTLNMQPLEQKRRRRVYRIEL